MSVRVGTPGICKGDTSIGSQLLSSIIPDRNTDYRGREVERREHGARLQQPGPAEIRSRRYAAAMYANSVVYTV